MNELRTTVGETMKWAGRWSAANVAVNLTGYALVAEVRRLPSRVLVASPTVALGDQSSAPGTYTVDVSGLPAGSYELRIRYTDPDSDLRRSTAVPLLVEVP